MIWWFVNRCQIRLNLYILLSKYIYIQKEVENGMVGFFKKSDGNASKKSFLKQYTIVDMFSGIGGLSLGFQQENFKLLLASDIDSNVAKTFKKNHPEIPFYQKDISKLNKKDLNKILKNKKVDILVGGIPCQSFSMAGNRIRKNLNGESDERHFLFKEFIRITKLLKPKIAIIENVKGILSIHKGKIKKEIIKSFEDLGYKIDYKVLNSADYGVPQLRERVLFVANRIKRENLFPKITHTPERHISVEEALKNLPELNHNPRKLSGITLKRVKLIKQGKNWQSLPKKLQTKSIHSGAYGRLNEKKPSRTIMTRFDTPSVGYVIHPKKHRTLTIREGARIQTFPDNFEFLGNTSSQNKQVGNAVPPKLSRAIAKQVKLMLN